MSRLKFILLLPFIGLLLISVAGDISNISRHPIADTGMILKSKANIVLASPESILHALDNLDLNAPDFPQKINTVVASGIKHYWPEPDENDHNVEYSFTENWILASATLAEKIIRSFAPDLPIRFGRIERYDLNSILEKGVGYCSQVSIALDEALKEKHITSTIIGLDGHVVVEATINNKNWILDPDYNVSIPFSLVEIEKNPSLIAKYYTANGLSDKTVTSLVKIYGKEGNQRGYSPLTAKIVSYSEIATYILPIFAIFLILLWKRKTRS